MPSIMTSIRRQKQDNSKFKATLNYYIVNSSQLGLYNKALFKIPSTLRHIKYKLINIVITLFKIIQ